MNRPGGDNININNIRNNNWNNWGVNRPGGDYWSQNHDWGDHWHDRCVPSHHHDWYHGCWNGHWGDNWYAPIVWGSVGWAMGSTWNSSWGYGPSYYNPYYDASAATPVYNYSQPVVVQEYATADAAGGTGQATANAAAQDPPENQEAMKLFDEGMAAFKAGNYQQALQRYDAALKLMPTDPVLHEVRALSLFALGRYKEAAATLNSLLATAPGMDWTSMSSLYGSVDDYTAQLRKLEAHLKANPSDASALFVLAYHYLVIGQNDAAVKALQEVVKLQPKDATAQRMLASLAPPESKSEEKPTEVPPPPTTDTPAPAGPSTDLVGRWIAKSGDATIELSIDDASQFTWKATPQGKPPIELAGTLASTSDTIVLESKDQGSMVGQVKSGGPDKFMFAMQGMPPGDPGLAFERVP